MPIQFCLGLVKKKKKSISCVKIGPFSMNIFNTWFLSKFCIFLRENIRAQYHFAVQKKKVRLSTKN